MTIIDEYLHKFLLTKVKKFIQKIYIVLIYNLKILYFYIFK